MCAIMDLERELSLDELDEGMDWATQYRPSLQRLYDCIRLVLHTWYVDVHIAITTLCV